MQVKQFNWIMPLGVYDDLALQFIIPGKHALKCVFVFVIMSQLQKWFKSQIFETIVVSYFQEDFEMTKGRMFCFHPK